MGLRKAIATLLALFVLMSSQACKEDGKYAKISGFAQGGTYSVCCRIPDGSTQEALQRTIDTILADIDQSLSGYNRSSLLSRLNSGEDLPLDSIFIRCFQRSNEIWQLSGGAFDPSAAPLFDLWGFGFEDGGMPSDEEVAEVSSLTGMDKFSLESRPDGIHLLKADSLSKLNFNAIAQGLSCDLIAEYLESQGCLDFLIDVGKEMMCRGEREQGGPWRIGIDKPADDAGDSMTIQDIVEVSGKGIVTSGNYRKFYVKDGKKYAHTIDPRTGYPVQHSLLSATVVADDATSADAFATWFMVVGLEEASRIVDSLENVEAYLVYGGQDDMQIWKSKGFETTEIN